MTTVSNPESQEQWADVHGIRVRYLEAGTGDPVVLVHGLLGYSFSWRFTIPALSSHFRMIAPDLPGAGFSTTTQNLEYRLRSVAERLLQFLNVVGIGKCHLVGSSHGGAVAMTAAAIEPQRVEKLVLVSPVNPWSRIGRRRARIFSNSAIAPVFSRWAPRFRFTHSWILNRLYGDAARISQGTLEGYSKPYAQPGAFAHNLAILRTWAEDLEQLKASLPRISAIPTLLIWGSLDRAVSPASAYELKKHFENSRLIVFEGVGHLPYEESPEDFNRTVSDFLLRV